MQDIADNELSRFFKDKRKDFSIINLIEEIYLDTKIVAYLIGKNG